MLGLLFWPFVILLAGFLPWKLLAPRRSLLQLLGVYLLSTVAFSGLGAFGGIWWADAEARGTFVHWDFKGAPPEPVIRLLAANYDSLFVETASGNLYECCWQQATPEDIESTPAPFTIPEGIHIADPPGVIVESVDLAYLDGGEFTPSYERYVLLDDGNVWRWKLWGGDISLSILPFFIYTGLGGGLGYVVGFIIGLLALGWWATRAKRLAPAA